MKAVMAMLNESLEKHPLLTMFFMSLALMRIVNNEVLSLGLGVIWTVIGLGMFFRWMGMEGLDL